MVQLKAFLQISQRVILLCKRESSLGLIDTILERPYSRNIIAKSNVSVAIIDKKIIHNILKENPIAAVLIKSLVIDIDNKFPEVWS